jgi:hypothetical protein
MNTIAESKHTSLIVQVEDMDENIIVGRVLVGDKKYKIGEQHCWSTSTFNISNNEPKKDEKVLDLYSSDKLEKWKNEGKDEIVQKVVDKFQERSKVGIEKYGTTLKDNNTDDFHRHFSEELMDALLYLEKIKEQKDTYFLLLGRYNELLDKFNKLQAKIKELC